MKIAFRSMLTYGWKIWLALLNLENQANENTWQLNLFWQNLQQSVIHSPFAAMPARWVGAHNIHYLQGLGIGSGDDIIRNFAMH